jgi:hypothetical protein
MISFVISVVPPKIDRTLLSRQSHNRAGEHRGSALAGPRPELSSGQREPRRPRDVIWAAITRQGIGLAAPQLPEPRRGRDDRAEPAAADIPAVGADVDSGELIAAQLPQMLLMHDPSNGNQVRSCSREPARRNQYLSRGKHAHHDSMGICGTP